MEADKTFSTLTLCTPEVIWFCLDWTKLQLFDYHEDSDAWRGDTKRGTNTSIGDLFPWLIPFTVYSRYLLSSLNLAWHRSVTALSARLKSHLKPLIFCSWGYLSSHLNLPPSRSWARGVAPRKEHGVNRDRTAVHKLTWEAVLGKRLSHLWKKLPSIGS